MNKNLLSFLLFLFSCSSLTAYAQKDKKNYTSSFYNRSVTAVSNILIVYRSELFTVRSSRIIRNILRDKCNPHNVTVNFAIIGSAQEDSLKNIAEFICRITGATFDRNSMVSYNGINKMNIDGKMNKKISVLGFLNSETEIPVWKCFCDLQKMRENNADKKAAECLYLRLLHDGIIK